jgi:hypothetical protein
MLDMRKKSRPLDCLECCGRKGPQGSKGDNQQQDSRKDIQKGVKEIQDSGQILILSKSKEYQNRSNNHEIQWDSSDGNGRYPP